jgi:4-amino-4-deoxy-L-arabinose transferase-like glycosyltransferase
VALVRLWVAGYTPLTDDEAYYRLWALAPASSYLDHPPIAGWMIAAGRWIAGDNPLGVRLAAPLASLLGPFILWRTAAILFDRNIAEWATWVSLAMPLLAVGGVIITPDTPSVLFWGLTVWALAELHRSQDAHWWLAVGLFSGLGLLSKYTNLFVGVGIALWIALVPANWRWLRSWQLWAGGALACALALPVIFWNVEHDWASFDKQFGRVARGEDTTLNYLLEFAGAYLGLASPLIAILAAWGLWIVLRMAVAERDQARVMLAVTIAPLVAYVLLHAVHARVQPNWVAPLYPALAICAAIALERIADPRVMGRVGAAALVVGFLFWGLLYVHVLRPIVHTTDLGDPTAQMRGWSQFAAEVDRLRAKNGARWVATSSYATTGQLAFGLKSAAPVVQLNERMRYAHLPPVDDALLASPAIYVELARRQRPWMLMERFASVTRLGNLVRSDRGVPIATYAVYLLADPIGSVLGPALRERDDSSW